MVEQITFINALEIASMSFFDYHYEHPTSTFEEFQQLSMDAERFLEDLYELDEQAIYS